ncbi:MAG: rhodanese-like domain-containing protein [Anaerolineae bacterium]|nr:rhodanese-like domain-containing protein [Anaerolineae bacterium]
MFARSKFFLTFAVAISLVLGACQGSPKVGQEVSVDGGSYRVVSAQELQTMLEDKDFTMINVHIPWQGDIAQTDLRLAYDQIEQNLNQLPAEKDAKIVVYCLTSGMAKKAVASLLSQGYTNVWMLDGGTTAWEESGLIINK